QASRRQHPSPDSVEQVFQESRLGYWPRVRLQSPVIHRLRGNRGQHITWQRQLPQSLGGSEPAEDRPESLDYTVKRGSIPSSAKRVSDLRHRSFDGLPVETQHL